MSAEPLDLPALSRWPLRTWEVVGSIVALTTLALAQPLLDLLGRNAAFLVAHDATGWEVLLIAVIPTLLAPAVLALVVVVLRRAVPAAAAITHALLLGVLGTVFGLVVLRLTGAAGAMRWGVAVAIGVGAGLGVCALYRWSSIARRVLAVAAVTAPVVAVMFLFGSPAKAVFLPSSSASFDSGVPANAPPVVVVIFDELPLASLLDSQYRIDANAFPAFASLAGDATWMRNMTTVHGQTSDAVPSALTGRYPQADKLPLAADHPNNLFTLLAPTHDMHVVEPLTELCPPTACPPPADSDAARLSTLVRDLGVVGSHLVLPPELTTSLPPIDQGWRDFRTQAKEQGKEIAFRDRFRAARATTPVIGAQRWIDEIRRSDRPTLHLLHVLLPHSPWRYAADGREYDATVDRPGLEYGRWVDDQWLVAQGYQRHLVQLQLTDRLLGQLLDRLKSEGIYDEAVVAVFADHGASLTPGESLRVIDRDTFREIGAVPFFLKLPRQTEPEVSDAPAEIIDVAPTLLAAAGGSSPPGIDGQSLLDGPPNRTRKQFFGPNGTLTFDVSLDPVFAAVDRKQQLFGASQKLPFPFGLAPVGTGHLLGRRAPAAAGSAEGLSANVVNLASLRDVDPRGTTVPSLIAGTLTGDLADGDTVAVALNGQILAVTLPDPVLGTAREFRALVPPSRLRRRDNELSLYVVRDGRLGGRIDVEPSAGPPDE